MNLKIYFIEEGEIVPIALVSKLLVAPKFRYSQLIKAGSNYICSGMIALDNDSGELINGDVGEQTEKIFSNLMVLMTEFTLTLEDLVSVRIFTTEFEKFSEINAIWEKFITEDRVAPARSSIGVTALPLDALVEIEFMFIKGS